MATTERCKEASIADTVGGPPSLMDPRPEVGAEGGGVSLKGAGADPGGGEHTLIDRRAAMENFDLLLMGVQAVS